MIVILNAVKDSLGLCRSLQRNLTGYFALLSMAEAIL